MSIFLPPINRRLFRRSDGKRSIALISTMALVAIVSLMLVAFVTAMRQDRTATYSYSQSLATEQVARGGLQLVVNELRRELMKDALPDYGTGNYTNNPIYTNLFSTNIFPQANVTNTAIPTLVKISTNSPFFSGARSQSPFRSSTLSSTTPSVNGRAMSLARWNRPFLGNFTATASTPYWVYITRGGVTNALGISVNSSGNTNSLNNRLPSNTNYAIGRFAYAIYDQGGLLDITVAGHNPTALTAAQKNLIKGTLAGADLRAITNSSGTPLIDPNALVAWRNKTTGASAATYLSYITNFASTNGFRKVFAGDTTFLSRQDLIKAALNNSAGFTTNALPFLTTFTREKNAPSWGPNGNLGGSYNYSALALTSGSTNRLTSLPRFTTTTTGTNYLSDGSPMTYEIKPGEPAIKRRFPLDRIKWITPSGPDTPDSAKAAAIQACFGLRWVPSSASIGTAPMGGNVWRYVGPTGANIQSSIKTLDQVANENREPNFFELLQAGLLTGSLGRSNDLAGGGTGTYVFNTAYQSSTMLQVLRIGASIIDQYDADSYPTVIEFSFNSVTALACGVESLPYLNVYNDVFGQSKDDPQAFAIYYVFGLWNPHQPGNIPVRRPNLRIRIQGSTAVQSRFGAGLPISPSGGLAGCPGVMNSIPRRTINLSDIGVNGFYTPAIIGPADVTPLPGYGTGTGGDWFRTPSLNSNLGERIGFRGKDLPLSFTIDDPDPAGSNFNDGYKIALSILTSDLGDPFQVMMEFESPTGWIPYNYFSGINSNAASNLSWLNRGMGTQKVRTLVTGTAASPKLSAPVIASKAFGASWDNFGHYPIWLTSDPRSLRLGFFGFPRSENAALMDTLRRSGMDPLWTSTMPDVNFRDSGYGGNNAQAVLPNIPQVQQIPTNGFSGTGTPYYPASFARNKTTGGTYNVTYKDPDNIVRLGDSGLFTQALTTSTAGNPFERTEDRPVVLNRAFLSVAEMGYAFRDLPWRSLDFFSSNSPDAGLLDLFCLSDAGNGVVAGRVNLNTRNAVVLQSILTGIITDPVSATTTLSSPAVIAQSLVAYTNPANPSGGPLANKSDLATRFVPSLSAANFSNQDEEKIKARREAIVRALSDVGQTRTWNLMIDMVTQTGKYPPNATTLDQFMVDGERRYWLHVAIDRITGEIVDQQLETVVE